MAVGTQVQVVDAAYKAFESITLVSSTGAVGLTAAKHAQYEFALITVEGAAVRFRADGTAPTTSVGHVLEDGDVLKLSRKHELANTQFIRRDDTNATLRCSYGN